MEKQHGPWTIRATRERFRSAMVRLDEHDVTKPDGSEGTYVTARIKDGVTVLAVGDDGTAYFAKEFRFAYGRETIEAVGGGVEEHESAAEAARRELREELGIEASEFVPLGAVQHMTSIVNSQSSLFLARGLSFTEKDGDPSERIATAEMPLEEAAARALAGDFIHSTTCLLVLRAHHYLAARRD